MTQELGPKQLAWVEALESGKYKQGMNYLHNKNDEFCCLGVACEVAGLLPVLHEDGRAYAYGSNEHLSYLPRDVVRSFEFRSGMGHSGDDHPSLAHLNDTGKTFAQIAALVRANPSSFFKEPV